MEDLRKAEVLHNTIEILRQILAGNYGYIVRYMHPDVIWLGASDKEYMRGREQFRQALRQISSPKLSLQMKESRFETAAEDERSCVVVGIMQAAEKGGGDIHTEVRATFLWEITEEGPKIRHVHISATMPFKDEDEYFPVRAAREGYQYMERQIRRQQEGSVISLSDSSGRIHVVNLNDILLVRADRNYTMVSRFDGREDIRIRGPFGLFMERLPDYFIRLSRSTAANAFYIVRVEGDSVVLASSERIHVPLRNAAAVRRRLKELQST